MSQFSILFIGDVVGATGRSMFQKHINRLRTQYQADAVVVNGENSASQGRGITPRIARFFKHNGASVITTGNHIWYKREIYDYLRDHTDVLRPANFPSMSPGVGVTTFTCQNHTIGIMNVQGRVFMKELVDCPFRTIDSSLTYLKSKTKIIFIDFHAETTSEKMAIAHYVDGRVSGVVGTHTHVQTADERVLPGGTAFITDLGMVGSLNGMLGMTKEPIIESFVSQMPVRFTVDTASPVILCGVCITVDTQTGKALSIKRVSYIDEELNVHTDEDES